MLKKIPQLVIFCGLFLHSVSVSAESERFILNSVDWNKTDQLLSLKRESESSDSDMLKKYTRLAAAKANLLNQDTFNDYWIVKSDDSKDIYSCRRFGNIEYHKNLLLFKTLSEHSCKLNRAWSTGYIESKDFIHYGYIESSIKITNASGINNAFWLMSSNDIEVDIAEVHYPNNIHITIHDWRGNAHKAFGYNIYLSKNLSSDFNRYAVLWLPEKMIFSVNDSIVGTFDTSSLVIDKSKIRLSTALTPFAGKTSRNPAGKDMAVKYVKFVALQK
ncbi:glycoside hydrolase family 16 protein [Klebsiella sp. RHBSTW-00215]|uniref:glycoside hydrolase family 16 protein n=1 Tax=Klebsiella sp. RHBSTW-00215 TaxID=2742640 RepID=UPI0015F568A9|nr:glycoside hydrolase family 16 protein [Klebsiella sp. RHBSTW-00215]MBA7934707.1 glycoside hydrolase family 16 protein [Klebsiella sp. RHBSTW-00215]